VSEQPWRIGYTPAAPRDLRLLDAQIRARVITALEQLAANDLRADVRRLSGTDEHRLRVGDWRVRFRHDTDSRQIVAVTTRPRLRPLNDGSFRLPPRSRRRSRCETPGRGDLGPGLAERLSLIASDQVRANGRRPIEHLKDPGVRAFVIQADHPSSIVRCAKARTS
jgi:mRNA-degrading endonuclease RelE of RelBE toxin-antitoxin system